MPVCERVFPWCSFGRPCASGNPLASPWWHSSWSSLKAFLLQHAFSQLLSSALSVPSLLSKLHVLLSVFVYWLFFFMYIFAGVVKGPCVCVCVYVCLCVWDHIMQCSPKERVCLMRCLCVGDCAKQSLENKLGRKPRRIIMEVKDCFDSLTAHSGWLALGSVISVHGWTPYVKGLSGVLELYQCSLVHRSPLDTIQVPEPVLSFSAMIDSKSPQWNHFLNFKDKFPSFCHPPLPVIKQ